MLKSTLIVTALLTVAAATAAQAEEGQMSRQTMARLGLGTLQTSPHTHLRPEPLPLPQPQPILRIAPVGPPPILGRRQLYILNHPPTHPRNNLGRTSVRIANRAFRF